MSSPCQAPLASSVLRRRRLRRRGWTTAIVILAVGCNNRPPTSPVSGKVLYNGAPLPYGTVILQPAQGQPAAGAIQPDGTFRLSTFAENDGATPGAHKVSVACYSSQSPAAKAKPPTGGEPTMGELLIPNHYLYGDQSGLTAEVPAEGTDSLLFELTGPPRKFPK